MLEFQPKNKYNPERGRLLVSEPFMEDPYFKRTVVLLCEHNEEGSFGFVLNKYIDVNIKDVIEDLPQMKSRISVGGPVKNENLFYLHTLGEELDGSKEVIPGVYIGGEFDILKERIKAGLVNEKQIRFFIGYSGWEEEQLNGELKEGSWLVLPAKGTDVMDTKQDDLWAQVLRDKGDGQSYFANFPEDPKLN
jgi:putative transcriptional regulator